jgi:hypothetical protein
MMCILVGNGEGITPSTRNEPEQTINLAFCQILSLS